MVVVVVVVVVVGILIMMMPSRKSLTTNLQVMCQTSQSRHIDNDIELCK